MAKQHSKLSPQRRSSSATAEASALIDQAAARRTAGDLRGAEQCYSRVLRADPDNAIALNGMGNLATTLRQLQLAIDFHRRAVKQAPRNAGLLNDLANSLILAGEPQSALPFLRKALGDSPRLRPALLNLARAHRDLNEPDRALEALDKLAVGPPPPGFDRDIDVDLERAVILAQTGRGSEATALFRLVLSARATDVRAIEGLATCHAATNEDNDLEAIEQALQQSGSSSIQLATMHRAAGKVLEDLGRYDAAFAQFKRANETAAAPFDMAAHLALVDGGIATFTRAFFATRTGFGFGEASEQPVFVVGMPRSGTTLVEQILASHPEVAGLGERPDIETGLFAAVPFPLGSTHFFEALRGVTAETSRRQAKRYLEAISRRSGSSRRAIDKMPHNFLVLGWIALLFPNARVIHCVRDPMDTCVSCFTHHFSQAHAYSGDLHVLGRYYRTYERLMRHWHATLPLRILDVRYEDLVDDLEQGARRMVAHLDLDWHPRCLEFNRSNRVVQTPSQWQVRQPVYHTSVGRWRRYERHVQPLVASLDSGARGTAD